MKMLTMQNVALIAEHECLLCTVPSRRLPQDSPGHTASLPQSLLHKSLRQVYKGTVRHRAQQLTGGNLHNFLLSSNL